MRALSPYGQEYERDASEVKFYVSIDDHILQVEFMGDTFAVFCEGSFTRVGPHGEIECASSRIKQIEIFRKNGFDSLALDLEHFKLTEKETFIKMEALAIDQLERAASKSDKWSAV